MSQRQPREDPRRSVTGKHLPVASKCLAIVLLPQKKHSKSTHGARDVNKVKDKECNTANLGNTTTTTTTTTSTAKVLPGGVVSGKEILEDFKEQNKTCYWNPALIESIRQLEYLGFVEPCTVLVGGEDIHLENLRSAWGRRVLKAPNNFTIDRIGDVNGIEMQVIPQTQFIPLPDSLCLIITELNNGSQPATLESIRARLHRCYSNANLPSHQLIYDTLGQLIRERKVIHNGNGYCVVTPEMYHLPTTADPSLACTASWLPYHPMYIPVFPQQQQPPYRAPTRSISCQVTQIEEKLSSEDSQHAGKKKTRTRSHSVRACRGKEKAAQAEKENTDFKRSSSARFKTEKAKAMTKDLNLKTSNLNQDKDKGEKVSLFSKLFGRKKKLTSAGTATTISTSSGGANQSTEAEFATFSGQFPPPEWLWYQQQLERQRRTEEWVSQQLPKSATWGHLTATDVVPSSGVAERGSLEMTLTESSSHPYSQPPAAIGGQQQTLRSQGHVYATLGHMQAGPATDVVRGGREDERRMKQQHRMSGSHTRKGHSHHQHQHQHHHRDRDYPHHKHVDPRKTLQENNYDIPVRQSRHYGTVSANPHMDVSPRSLEEDNIYSTPGPGQYGQGMPWHSTPCYDIPPAQFDSLAMPSHIMHNNTTQQQEPSDAGKIQSSHNPHHQRRAHRSKRRGHKTYSMFDASAGNDISIEYKGRMPKKNSTVAQSRDSGVNCMGLPQNRQHYLEEPELHMTQEASAYLPCRMEHPAPNNTATASSLQPDTMSTQRGTPYTSMEQRDPEGCSQRQPIINAIVNPISLSSTEMNSGGSPNSDDLMHRDGGPSGASGGGEEEEEGRGCSTHDQQPGFPQLEDRSEGEGVSHSATPLYVAMCSDVSSSARGPDSDTTPQYVAMSYCDSSMGEEGAGGGEVLLCQAEINQFQVPQLVLDTESRLDCGNRSSEPDIALSSAGSKDTLDRTADESERSVETVVRSPHYSGLEPKSSDRLQGSGDGPHSQQSNTVAADATGTTQGGGEGQVERCVVSALGSEFKEMGVVDSGFSSPRNNDDKENQQQQPAPSRKANQARHVHVNAPAASEVAVEHLAMEHKSKHDRIKAFVKQSNQLLEQRQFTGHGNVPFGGGSIHCAAEHDSSVNYLPQNTHLQQHPHPYAPFTKPLHSATAHHQQVAPQAPILLNNQKHHHHQPSRPLSVHGGLKERSKSQNVWPGQGQGMNPEKMSPNDLKAFQEQQLKGKKFGLNGEFEVVGVV